MTPASAGAFLLQTVPSIQTGLTLDRLRVAAYGNRAKSAVQQFCTMTAPDRSHKVRGRKVRGRKVRGRTPNLPILDHETERLIMMWLHDLAYFFGGVFLANAVPHYVSGMIGRPFQSPFAKPPGKGLSSIDRERAVGFANLVVSYCLVLQVGQFDLRAADQIAAWVGPLAHGRDGCADVRAVPRWKFPGWLGVVRILPDRAVRA